MTSLFRPWTEENSVKTTPGEITNLLSDSSEPPAEDTSTRESKYQSVKEHIKKRSEKYLLKKLKLRSEKAPDIVGICDNSSVDNTTAVPPICCVPPEPYLPSFECIIPRNLPPVSLPITDFVDPVLTHGLSSSVFEEYAKFLTEQQRIVSERSRKQRPKKFRCPHCHVGFSNNGQLKGHIRIHTGERPFKCDAESCGKSFTRNEELTRHRRIHSGLRPFPCPECGKRFGRKDHLKKHIKTHFQQRYQLVPILPSHCSYFYGLC